MPAWPHLPQQWETRRYESCNRTLKFTYSEGLGVGFHLLAGPFPALPFHSPLQAAWGLFLHCSPQSHGVTISFSKTLNVEKGSLTRFPGTPVLPTWSAGVCQPGLERKGERKRNDERFWQSGKSCFCLIPSKEKGSSGHTNQKPQH